MSRIIKEGNALFGVYPHPENNNHSAKEVGFGPFKRLKPCSPMHESREGYVVKILGDNDVILRCAELTPLGQCEHTSLVSAGRIEELNNT